MSLFTPKPPFPTKLGQYRQLASRAGIHVSPIALGGMSLGDEWEKYGMGAMNKESSFKLLDCYFNNGGNFIDTANNYQDGSSERYIGEWAEKRGIRDQLVICTKYTNNPVRTSTTVKQHVNYVGNNLKSLKLSLENSLKNLRTDYIDILYLHYWDLNTNIEEVMDGLHHLVVAGKVLYLGVSDTPAWLVTKANEYARLTGKTPFVVYQAPYSVIQRDIERDIIPMCRYEGMAITFWNVLAGGKIRSTADEDHRRQTGEKGRALLGPWERTESEVKVCAVLEQIQKEVGCKSIQAVAIAHTLLKAPFSFPVIGGRKTEHLLSNLEALDINLSEKQVKEIENASVFDKGFPSNIIGEYGTIPFLIGLEANMSPVPLAGPVKNA